MEHLLPAVLPPRLFRVQGQVRPRLGSSTQKFAQTDFANVDFVPILYIMIDSDTFSAKAAMAALPL